MSSNSYPSGDISQLIRLKERELHEIHDMRCSQLEKLVAEKESQLNESIRRFEQLRDDFQYNFALLEARDNEIRRLTGLLDTSNKSIMTLESEKRSLVDRLEALVLRDKERDSLVEEEKNHGKAKLLALREEIERLGWVAADESKSKTREIETLRNDLLRVSMSRDEAIEAQRKDLTHTFEQLMEQREIAFNTKEREIALQIAALDERFEQLRTENLRLKSENVDCDRRLSSLQEELTIKDTLLRQVMWRAEDERQGKIQADDVAQRQIQKLTVELSQIKDTSSRETTQYQLGIEKALNDCAREVEFRKEAEARFEQSKTHHQSEVEAFERQLNEAYQRLESIQLDAERLRGERDHALDRASLARADAEAAEAKYKALSRQVTGLQAELQSDATRIQQLEQELHHAMQQAADAIHFAESTTREELIMSRREAEAAVQANQRINDAELEQVRQAARTLQEEIVQDVTRKFEYQIKELEARMRQQGQDVETSRANLVAKDNELREERAENAALRLRMRYYDEHGFPTSHAAQAQLNDRYPLRSSQGSDGGNDFAFHNKSGGFRTSSGDMNPPSPMFSEDFGPISVPESPLPTPQRSLPAVSTIAGQHGTIRSYQADNGRVEAQSALAGNLAGSIHATSADAVFSENERLRAIIREMRSDMEQLQSHSTPSANNERIALLEQRLESTVGEVTRLRAERRRLMDVSNELRAVASRQPTATSPHGHYGLPHGEDMAQSSIRPATAPPRYPEKEDFDSSSHSGTDRDDIGAALHVRALDVKHGGQQIGVSSGSRTNGAGNRVSAQVRTKNVAQRHVSKGTSGAYASSVGKRAVVHYGRHADRFSSPPNTADDDKLLGTH